MDYQWWLNPFMARARDLLAGNLKALKESNLGLDTQEKIQARAHGLGLKISQSTISRALSGAVALDLDTLDTLARVFGKKPFELLQPAIRGIEAVSTGTGQATPSRKGRPRSKAVIPQTKRKAA